MTFKNIAISNMSEDYHGTVTIKMNDAYQNYFVVYTAVNTRAS